MPASGLCARDALSSGLSSQRAKWIIELSSSLSSRTPSSPGRSTVCRTGFHGAQQCTGEWNIDSKLSMIHPVVPGSLLPPIHSWTLSPIWVHFGSPSPNSGVAAVPSGLALQPLHLPWVHSELQLLSSSAEPQFPSCLPRSACLPQTSCDAARPRPPSASSLQPLSGFWSWGWKPQTSVSLHPSPLGPV